MYFCFSARWLVGPKFETIFASQVCLARLPGLQNRGISPTRQAAKREQHQAKACNKKPPATKKEHRKPKKRLRRVCGENCVVTFSRHLLSMCVLRAPMSNGRFELRCRRVDNTPNAGPDGNYTALKKTKQQSEKQGNKTKHPVCVCCAVWCVRGLMRPGGL